MLAVRITENFAQSLGKLRAFLAEQDAGAAFTQLTATLFATLIPNLQAYPELGRSLFARAPASVEGQARWRSLRERLSADADIREYIGGDYLVLYAVLGGEIAPLSVKHHRQLSYDLARFYLDS